MSDQQLEKTLAGNTSDSQAIQPEQEETTILEKQSEEEQVNQEKQPTQEETAQARNFKALKLARERAERERDDAMRRVQELEAVKSVADESDIDIAPEALAEGRHVSKLNKRIRLLEEKIVNYQQQTTLLTTEARLRAQFPDFDEVVSKDNIEMLRASEPEIAQTLNSSPDLYNKAVTAYKMIKKFGIVPDQYQQEKERVAKNLTKPRSSASVSPQQGTGPLSQANSFAQGLTPDLKKQLYQEMIESAKRHS